MAHSTLIAPLDDGNKIGTDCITAQKWFSCDYLGTASENFGLLPQRKEFISKILNLLDLSGALVILMKRYLISSGNQWMAEDLAMQPDLVTYGKSNGGRISSWLLWWEMGIHETSGTNGACLSGRNVAIIPLEWSPDLPLSKDARQQTLYPTQWKDTKIFVMSDVQFKYNDFPLQLALWGLFILAAYQLRKRDSLAKDFSPNSASVLHEIFRKLLEQGVYQHRVLWGGFCFGRPRKKSSKRLAMHL